MPKFVVIASGFFVFPNKVKLFIAFVCIYNSTTALTRLPIFVPNSSVDADCSKDVPFGVSLIKFSLSGRISLKSPNPIVSAYWEHIFPQASYQRINRQPSVITQTSGQRPNKQAFTKIYAEIASGFKLKKKL